MESKTYAPPRPLFYSLTVYTAKAIVPAVHDMFAVVG